jgi:hypothetical protein
MVKAIRDRQIRHFTLVAWEAMPDDHYGWRQLQEGDDIEVEIIEKKNIAQQAVAEAAVTETGNVPGFYEGDEPKTGVDITKNELIEIIKQRGYPNEKELLRMNKSKLMELYDTFKK